MKIYGTYRYMHNTLSLSPAADAQHVMIVSEGVEGDGYVHVGKLITFAVEKTSDAVVS